MAKTFIAVFLFALAGCSGVPRRGDTTSPCDAGEASHQCQIERYRNVSAQ